MGPWVPGFLGSWVPGFLGSWVPRYARPRDDVLARIWLLRGLRAGGKILPAPVIEETRQPGADTEIVHGAVLEMGDARLGARQRQGLVAAGGPAAHHCVGHFRVELDRV